MGLAGVSFFLRLISFAAAGVAMVLLIAYVFTPTAFKEFGMSCKTAGTVTTCAKNGDYYRGRGLIFSTINFCKEGKTAPAILASAPTSPKTYDGEACSWTFNWLADTKTEYLTTMYETATPVQSTTYSVTSFIVSDPQYSNKVLTTTKKKTYEGETEKFNNDLMTTYNNSVAALCFLIGAFFLYLASLLNSLIPTTSKLAFFGRLALDALLIVFVFQGMVIGFTSTLANRKYSLKAGTSSTVDYDFKDVYVLDGGSSLMFLAFILTCVYGVLNIFYHIAQRKLILTAQSKASASAPVAPHQPTLAPVPGAGNPYGSNPYGPPQVA